MKVYYRILFPFLLLVLGPGYVYPQNVFDGYEKEIIVKNHVKSKSHMVFGVNSGANYKSLVVLYNENGNMLEETSYRSTGVVALKRNYKYDERGNVIEYQSFDGLRNKITYKKFVKYDEKNNKISEVGFDGVDRFDNKYFYDAQNRLQEIRYYVSDNLVEKRLMKYGTNIEVHVYKADNSLAEKQVKHYDSKKNLLKEIFFSASGTEKKRNEYEYDNSGNMLTEAKYYAGKLKEKKTYAYSNNKLIKVYMEKPDVEKFLHRVYEYDASGKLTMEKWSDNNSGKYSTKVYKYDSKGNPISIESYFATYDFSEDVKINYTYY